VSCICLVGEPLVLLNLPSPTTLKAFDGHGFQPHRLLQYFTVTLKGKTISVDIEVVDAPLDYNLLLGHSWFYAMTVHRIFGVSYFTISPSRKNYHC
jgi:hypothetical protein